jgi:hypothetical protein
MGRQGCGISVISVEYVSFVSGTFKMVDVGEDPVPGKEVPR